MNNFNINQSFGGEYVVQVEKPDGSITYPFGEKPLKNLILDTFLLALATGYRNSQTAYIQSCILGANSTPVNRTQTGIVGNILSITHASDSFDRIIDSGNSSVSLSRNFRFDQETGAVTYREASIGCFGIQNLFNITTSRIVFPSDVILQNGHRMLLNYRLNINLPWLTRDYPFVLSGDNTVFSGALRACATNSVNILGPTFSSSTIGISQDIYTPSVSTYFYRTFSSNSTSTSSVNTSSAEGAGFNTLIPTKTTMSDRSDNQQPNNRVGFYGNHVPPVFPNRYLLYTPSGPEGSLNRASFGTGISGVTATINYYLPGHTSDRNVSGLYLNADDNGETHSNPYALYFKFTTGCFIPASKNISINIQWQLNRQ